MSSGLPDCSRRFTKLEELVYAQLPWLSSRGLRRIERRIRKLLEARAEQAEAGKNNQPR